MILQIKMYSEVGTFPYFFQWLRKVFTVEANFILLEKEKRSINNDCILTSEDIWQPAQWEWMCLVKKGEADFSFIVNTSNPYNLLLCSS